MAADATGLNSLRQALTPYDDVKFELNLNRHPKAHTNKSLTHALNMKLSKDTTVIENEESVVENTYIKGVLSRYYTAGYDILHILPCNIELVLFVKGKDYDGFNIWRYREKTNNHNNGLALFYNKTIPYNGGVFSSDFTYTSNDSLIIGFCEYDSTNKEKNPLSTINLGTFTKGYILSTADWFSDIGEFNDRDLEPYKLPICPEVIMPIIVNNNISIGHCYTGTYYFYIRYKINKYDHTQWFSFGYPILLEHKNISNISKKLTTNKKDKDTFGKDSKGAFPTDRYNSLDIYTAAITDLVNSSINLDLANIDIRYSEFDLGVICISKTYTKYYTIEGLNTNTTSITIDINKMIENVFNTNTYENYYNVKNIVNKDNKLYISNYLTTNDENIDVSNVNLQLNKTYEIVEEEIGVKDSITINDVTLTTDQYLKTFWSSVTFATGPLTYGVYSTPGFPATTTYNKAKFVNFVAYLEKIGCGHMVTNPMKIKLYDRTHDAVSSWLTEKEITIDPTTYFICVIDQKNYIPDSIKNSSYINKDYLYILADETSIKTVIAQGSSPQFPNDYRNDVGQPGYGYSDYTSNTNFRPSPSETFDVQIYDSFKINGVDISSKFKDMEYISVNVTPYNKYAQTINGIINNNILTGLCKGEIYDFYIHFVDKYGHISNGYRLTNNDVQYKAYFNHNGTVELHDVCFFNYVCDHGSTPPIIIAIPKDLKLFWKGNLNIAEWCLQWIQSPMIADSKGILNYLDSGGNIQGSIQLGSQELSCLKVRLADLTHLSDYYKNILTWGDILDGIPSELYNKFTLFTNNDKHKLFRVPNIINNPNNNNDINIKKLSDFSVGFTVDLTTVSTILSTYDFKSFFISHKKLEKTYLLDGFGTKYNMTNILLNEKNNKIGDIIKLCHISPKLHTDITAPLSINNNTIQSSSYQCYVNSTNNVAYTGDAQAYRQNRHSCVYFTNDIDNEINIYDIINDKDYRGIERRAITYIKTMNIDKNIYTANNKHLYRLGNILNLGYRDVKDGLNGLYKPHYALWFGNKDYGVNDVLSESGQTSYGETYLFKMYDFYDDDENTLYLEDIATSVRLIGNTANGNTPIDITEIFYPVIKTLNLFGYKNDNIYNSWIDFYQIYNSNNDYLNEFNRTIYRSQVISDEGRTNNWRWFENDAYKNVEENKGNITNLVAIGNYLYVHAEHSLFAFSEDNTLSMNNQNLQVATPDIFDTEYKEQFITKLGYGGLQDMDARISGYFGYIWFDRSSKRIYKIYGESMDIVSKDITEWFENVDIIRVDFADDIKNNRILINIKIKDDAVQTHIGEKDITLSYNTITKTMISFHDYHFSKAYTTKNNLYFLQDIAGSNFDEIHEFDEDNYGFNLGVQKYYSLSFIVNKYYQTLKYLEYIIYKLRKRHIKNANNMHNYIITGGMDFPVEQLLMPYAGDNVRVFNDLVDTNLLPCGTMPPSNSVVDYDKPYWDLGNWHFSFLKDHNTNAPGGRLYGNYFIIHFDLGHVTELLEFESFDVTTTEDKKPLM